MRLDRYYTNESASVFGEVKTKTITIEICHEEPSRRLCIPDFEVPEHWSQRAAEHLAHHYVRRTCVPAATKPIAEEGVPEWLQKRTADTIRLNEIAESLRYGSETSYRQVVHRLVGAWTYWGWTHGYFDTESDAKSFYDEMAHLIIKQQAMPASPQWCNTGLHWAYGIAGDAQGGVYVDAQSGELIESDSAYERPQHHHCFIQGVKDDLSGEGGITDLWQREMRVFKHGSGSGCNMSAIRGEVETLSNGMRPAGLVPFMDISEKAAQTLASVSERADAASKFSLIDCDHPDMLRVLRWRLSTHRERIANAIGTAKQRVCFQKIHSAIRLFDGDEEHRYDPTINHELADVIESVRQHDVSDHYIMQYVQELRACAAEYRQYGERVLPKAMQARSVSQLGLRLSDGFMRAANSAGVWSLKCRTDHSETETAYATDMLDEMAYFNWLTGDGIMQFSDTVEFWNGCKAVEPIRASSPNGEFLFLDHSACDVAVINLAHYLTDEGTFDIAGFEHTVRLQTIMCDIAITMAQFPSSDVAYNSYRYRPIGLSFCNMAALLMAMGYAYDSAEGRAIAASIAALMTGKGYVTSAEMARELGGFEAFSEVRDSMMQLMWQHHEAAFGRTQHLGTADICPAVLDHSTLPDGELGDAVQKVWDLAMIQGDEFGYSNAQISLIASSPNIMILMDALTPGISPMRRFDHRESGIKEMSRGLTQLGYKPDQIEAITSYVFGHQTLFCAPGINQQALRQRGFTENELSLIEDALKAGYGIHGAFDPLHLGEKFCRDTLKLNDAQLHNADFKLLYHLGFDDEAVESFEQHIAGHATVNGAPFLRSEDYAIFATADQTSEQPIAVESQIQMAASIQPYISGGIANRIDTPACASVKQHRHWMMMAWQLGLKHIELQRMEDSYESAEAADEDTRIEIEVAPIRQQVHAVKQPPKPTQNPPKFAIEDSEIIGMIKLAVKQQQAEVAAQQTAAAVKPAPAPVAAAPVVPTPEPAAAQPKATAPEGEEFVRPKMRNMPNRRRGYVQDAQVGGVLVRHRVEEYSDGSLGAIDLELPDCEINFQQALQQSAQVLSIALQYGVPIDAFAALASERAYGPQGVVIGHSDVSQAQSVMDYLLQDVLPEYQEQLNEQGAQSVLRDLLNLAASSGAVPDLPEQEEHNNPEPVKDNALS